MTFYKYRKFTDNHVDAIVHNKIWFSTGDTFNDPFDIQPPLNLLTYESMARFVRQKTMAKLLSNSQFKDVVQKQLNEANQLYKENKIQEHAIWPYFQYIAEVVYRRFIFCLRNYLLIQFQHDDQILFRFVLFVFFLDML